MNGQEVRRVTPNPAWFGDFQDARTGAVMRRNLQTGEPELVPRQPGEARLQSESRGDFYPPNTLGGVRESADRGLFGTHPDRMRWPDAAAQIALLAAAGPVTRLAGQGLGAAYGAAKPVVQGVARRVGGAMKSAPFDPVRRKVLQAIGGLGTAAAAGWGAAAPGVRRVAEKVATPMLDQFHALLRAPRWTWSKGWPYPRSGTLPTSTSDYVKPQFTVDFSTILRLKNGQPVTEEMLKKAGFRAAMHGNKVIGTHPVSAVMRRNLQTGEWVEGQPLSNLMKQMDAPSQALFRALTRFSKSL